MQKTVSRRAYIAIDLKSFYASVECIERGLDPLTTNLVVANPSRTEKTICLAVSPPLKSYGVPGRPRLFEVIQRIREVNEERRHSQIYDHVDLVCTAADGILCLEHLDLRRVIAVGKADDRADLQPVPYIFLCLAHIARGDAHGSGVIGHPLVTDFLHLLPSGGGSKDGMVYMLHNLFLVHMVPPW